MRPSEAFALHRDAIRALEDHIGIAVDVRTPGDLPEKFRGSVLAEAQPV